MCPLAIILVIKEALGFSGQLLKMESIIKINIGLLPYYSLTVSEELSIQEK